LHDRQAMLGPREITFRLRLPRSLIEDSWVVLSIATSRQHSPQKTLVPCSTLHTSGSIALEGGACQFTCDSLQGFGSTSVACQQPIPLGTIAEVTLLMDSSHEEPLSRFYESQRLRLHYAVWNGSGGPPLLLIHGSREHCRSWDFVARALKGRYTIYAPDLRGHGDSEWATGGCYGIPECVADIAALADIIGSPLALMGCSRGGNIALQYAGIFPERVSKVVAIEGLGRPVAAHQTDGMAPAERMRHWIDSRRSAERRQLRRHASLEEATRRITEVDSRVRPDIARHLALHGVRRNEDGTYSWKFDNYLLAGGPHPDGGQELWANIRAPVLLVSGSESWSSHPEWLSRALVTGCIMTNWAVFWRSWRSF